VVIFSPNVKKVEKWKSSKDTHKLLEALDTYDVEVHLAAIRALNELKAVEAVPRLQVDLRHPLSSEIRGAAADALGAMKASSCAKALIEALGDDVPLVSKAAYKAVLGLGKASITPLLDSLKDYRSERVRDNCLQIIREMGRNAQPELIEGLKSGSSGLRQHCAILLGATSDPQVTMALEEALLDKSPEVRRAAAESLRKQGILPRNSKALAYYYVSLQMIDEAASLGPVAVDALKTELDNRNFRIRRQVAVNLRKVDWKPQTMDEAIAFWIAAGKFSETVKYGEEAQEPLMRMLSDSNIKVKKGAAAALKKIGVPQMAKQMVRDIERMSDITYFRLKNGTFDVRRIGLPCQHYKGKLYLLSLENADAEQEKHILSLYPDAEIIGEDEAV